MRPAPDEPRFSFGIALAAWGAAFVLSTLGSAVLLMVTGYGNSKTEDLPLWLIGLLQVPLWVCLLGAVLVVSKRFGTNNLRRDYGLAFAPIDLIGLPLGILTQLVFVPLLYVPIGWFVDTSDVSKPAEQLTSKATGPSIFLLVVLVVVGAPIIEELFFRGLILRSIQARWNDSLALIGSAVLFGLAHFQPLQLPALVMFGLIAGYCAQRTGRLGMPMLAHAGFNATTVYLLVRG